MDPVAKVCSGAATAYMTMKKKKENGAGRSEERSEKGEVKSDAKGAAKGEAKG